MVRFIKIHIYIYTHLWELHPRLVVACNGYPWDMAQLSSQKNIPCLSQLFIIALLPTLTHARIPARDNHSPFKLQGSTSCENWCLQDSGGCCGGTLCSYLWWFSVDGESLGPYSACCASWRLLPPLQGKWFFWVVFFFCPFSFFWSGGGGGNAFCSFFFNS